MALVLTSCGGGGSNPVTGATSAPVSTTGFSSIRFVDGSPDANGGGAVDFNIDGTTVLPGYSYGAVTPYYDIPSGAGHSFGAYVSGTTTAVLTSIALTSTGSQAYTFVLAGRAALGTQHWIAYADPQYTSLITQFTFTVHDASPYANANGISTFQFGVFSPPASATTVYSADSSAGYPPASASASPATPYVPNTPALLPATAATAPGVEFFAASAQPATGATLPASSLLLPSAINAGDTAETLPNASATVAPSFYHCSLFVIDSLTAPYYVLVGGQD